MNDRSFADDHHSGEYSIRRKSMPSFPLLPSVKPHSRLWDNESEAARILDGRGRQEAAVACAEMDSEREP